MAIIDVKPKSQCKYDILSLGEIMIRLDPGDFGLGKAAESTMSPEV